MTLLLIIVQITKCADGDYVVRHRGKANTHSELFPCSFVTEWQAEFVFDKNVANVVAMFPKIVGLVFEDQKVSLQKLTLFLYEFLIFMF